MNLKALQIQYFVRTGWTFSANWKATYRASNHEICCELHCYCTDLSAQAVKSLRKSPRQLFLTLRRVWPELLHFLLPFVFVLFFFAETFWSLKYFGHLSHSCIETRHNCIFSLDFQFWSKWFNYFQSIQKRFGLWPKNTTSHHIGSIITGVVRGQLPPILLWPEKFVLTYNKD